MGRLLRALLAAAVAAGCSALSRQATPLAALQELSSAHSVPGELKALFHDWLATAGRAYKEGSEEFERRLRVWAANYRFVEEYNAQTTTHQLGMNAFADMTNAEYRARLGYTPELGLRLSRGASPFRYHNATAADSVDWVARGAVTGVKDQGQCGSCWAFSTTGSLESANFLANGQLVALSEQELIDCDRAGNDRGCNGGLMDYAYEFIIANGGLDTEQDYPYEARDGVCDPKKERTDAIVVTAFEDVPPHQEALIKKAVSNQPVAVAVAAGNLPFQLYKSGVFDSPTCGTALDHGVLLVGYGSDEASGKPFWLLKNSWGTVWGDAGFMKLLRSDAPGPGQCGLASVPSYPVVKAVTPEPPAPPSPPAPPLTPPPPPPPPGPPPSVQCDGSTTCPASTTCCCVRPLPFVQSICLQWGCCPYPDATCCADHKSCCPGDHPVCDLDQGVCHAAGLDGAAGAGDTVPVASKFAASARSFTRATISGAVADARAAVAHAVA